VSEQVTSWHSLGMPGNFSTISALAVDSAICFIHTALLTVTAISLLLVRCTKTVTSVQRSRLPSRTMRTILMLILIAVQVLLLLKDVLSTSPTIASYVASLLTAVGTTACLVYSDVVGSLRPVSAATILLLYWLMCETLQLLRLVTCFLSQPSLTWDSDVCVVLDSTVFAIYFALIVVELVFIIGNVSSHVVAHFLFWSVLDCH